MVRKSLEGIVGTQVQICMQLCRVCTATGGRVYVCIAVKQGDASNAIVPSHCLVCFAVQLPAQALDAVYLLSIHTRKQLLHSLQSSAGQHALSIQ